LRGAGGGRVGGVGLFGLIEQRVRVGVAQGVDLRAELVLAVVLLVVEGAVGGRARAVVVALSLPFLFFGGS
jgi:hypothetical protein